MRPAEHWIETVADVICFSAIALTFMSFMSLMLFAGMFIGWAIGL